jgi:hypothetical protein
MVEDEEAVDAGPPGDQLEELVLGAQLGAAPLLL